MIGARSVDVIHMFIVFADDVVIFTISSSDTHKSTFAVHTLIITPTVVHP